MAAETSPHAAFFIHAENPQSPPCCRKKRTYSAGLIEKMKNALKPLGFDCEDLDAVDQATDMDNRLRHLSTRNFEDYKIVLIFISAYGLGSNNIHCRDRHYPLQEKIDQYFLRSDRPGLVMKEKVFFVQACDPCWRSNQSNDGTEDTNVASAANNSIFWSPIPGDEKDNAVHHFCEVLSEKTEMLTLDQIFTETRNRICVAQPSWTKLPETHSMATSTEKI